MANESALKVCQQKTNGAPRVIAFQDCFMGRSTTMAQIGDSAAGRVGIPLNAQVDYMLSELVTQQQEGWDDNDECEMDYGDKAYDSEDDCTGGTAAFGEYRYESE